MTKIVELNAKEIKAVSGAGFWSWLTGGGPGTGTQLVGVGVKG